MFDLRYIFDHYKSRFVVAPNIDTPWRKFGITGNGQKMSIFSLAIIYHGLEQPARDIHGAYRATSLSIVASFRGATFSRRHLQSTGTEKEDFNSAIHLIVCLCLVRQQNREEKVKGAKTLTFASKFGIDSGALLRLPVSMLANQANLSL
jgi:hypothetical protein